MSNIFIGLKKDLFGCFRIDEIRDKDNETGLKEGGCHRNVNYSASITRCSLLRLKYLPTHKKGLSASVETAV